LPDEDAQVGVLLALPQDDGKNQLSRMTWGRGAQAEVAVALWGDFLVSAERVLTGRGGRRAACRECLDLPLECS
jgi:hypothetical protein